MVATLRVGIKPRRQLNVFDLLRRRPNDALHFAFDHEGQEREEQMRFLAEKSEVPMDHVARVMANLSPNTYIVVPVREFFAVDLMVFKSQETLELLKKLTTDDFKPALWIHLQGFTVTEP